jgi:hypothetical protein
MTNETTTRTRAERARDDIVQPTGAVRVYRMQAIRRAAESHQIGVNQLWRATHAVWSNLNPQSVNFERALSVAIVALKAADHGSERITP